MSKIMIKRVEETYSKDSDIRKLLRYIVKNKKKKQFSEIRYWSTRGLPKDYKKAANLIIDMQKLLGKNKGRRMNQVIISFPIKYKDTIMAKRVADILAEWFYEEYQVLYGVHEDTACLHIHFAINTVSYKDSKKWHKTIQEFNKWIKKIGNIIGEQLVDENIELVFKLGQPSE